MALDLPTLRAELTQVEQRITELHAIERAEGAARAFPELPEQMHRRMTLRGHIEALEKIAASPAHASEGATDGSALGTPRD